MQTCCSISYGTPAPLQQHVNTLGDVLVDVVGCRIVIFVFTVLGNRLGVIDRKGENPCNRSVTVQTESRQRKLHVLLEPGDADADEPQRAGPVAQRAVEERARELADPRGVVGADGQRGRAGADREVGIANLRRDRARDLAAAAQMLRELARTCAGARRGGARDRRCRARRSPRARSRCARSRPRAAAGRCRARGRAARGRPCPAARCCRSSSLSAAMSPIVVDAERATRRSSARGPTPGQEADRERREERRLATRADGRQPGRACAGRRRPSPPPSRSRRRASTSQLRPRPHDRLHRLGERPRVVERRRDLAEIEIALVDSRLLDRRDDLAHRRPDLARVVPVERVPRPDEDGVRAAPQRLGARHRRVDAEAPRDVVRGRDDPAPVRVAADDQRHSCARSGPPAPRRRRRRRRGRDARRYT